MKLQTELDNRTFEVQLDRRNEIISASVDGRPYELEVSEPEPGVFLFKVGGKIYEATISKSTIGDAINVRIGSGDFDVRVIDPKRLRSAGEAGHDADGIAEIKTAMPGKVVRVLVPEGAEVVKGAGVIVVEAMKMQNELKSPKDGTVKEIRAQEGATVAAGDILATIE